MQISTNRCGCATDGDSSRPLSPRSKTGVRSHSLQRVVRLGRQAVPYTRWLVPLLPHDAGAVVGEADALEDGRTEHRHDVLITYIYYALSSSVMFSHTRMNLKREAVYD